MPVVPLKAVVSKIAIEEVGCCDAWMAERTHSRIDRRLRL